MSLFSFKLKEGIKSVFARFRKVRVKAVHDSDLIEVLESLGVLDEIQTGGAKCSYCGGVVNLDTLEAVFSEGKVVKFVCSKNECISKL